MGTIKVNYDEVFAETTRLKNHISSNIIRRVNTEYRQIQAQLRRGTDGATNAMFQDALEVNCTKAIAAADALEKLIQFINASARQIEASEERIARTMRAGRRI